MSVSLFSLFFFGGAGVCMLTLLGSQGRPPKTPKTPPLPPAQPQDEKLSYRRLRLLGQGSFGKAFLARDLQNGELVVMKQAASRASRAFLGWLGSVWGMLGGGDRCAK